MTGTDITVPKAGLTVDEVEVVEWLVAEGAEVTADQPVVILNADKTEMEVTAPAAGTLRSVSGGPGDIVAVGAVLGRIDVGDGSFQESEVGAPDTATDAARLEPATPPVAVADVGPPVEDLKRLRISPAARAKLRELGRDATRMVGTGPDGRIVLRDIESSSGSLPAVGAGLSRSQRVVAARMSESARTVAPVTLHRTVTVDRALRRQRDLRAEGTKATLTHLILGAVADALDEHPDMARRWEGDDLGPADPRAVGLAVDVDGDLFVGTLRVPTSTGDVVTSTRELVDAIRTRRMAPAGPAAAITVSSLGGVGVEEFTPIVNLPEIAVLGVGAARPEPAFVDGELREVHRLGLSLTFDHRAVNGAPAGRFLGTVARLLAEV